MNTNIVICGAGITGVATAYYLSKKWKNCTITLIDKQQPLSFTTSKSGENFRDYWPQACMAGFVNRSIQLMENLRKEHGQDSFEMKYSGYDFVSQLLNGDIFPTNHAARGDDPIFETITNPSIIRQQYPYLDNGIKKIIRIKKAGKIDVFAMGSLLLKEAKMQGVRFIQGEIKDINKVNGNYNIQLNDDSFIKAEKVVIAAGPFINQIAEMLGIVFPIDNILQHKFLMPDPDKIIPENMPFTIFADAQYINWTDEEKEHFRQDNNYRWLLDKFPGGLHIKPESGKIKMGWAFNQKNEMPTWENNPFDEFPMIVLRAASRFIPQLKKYADNIPAPLIQYSGYYTRTKENWPLIGPASLDNLYVVGGLSGYGTMSACAAGELCAAYICGDANLPFYAPYFHPDRYQNPKIADEILLAQSDGQL